MVDERKERGGEGREGGRGRDGGFSFLFGKEKPKEVEKKKTHSLLRISSLLFFSNNQQGTGFAAQVYELSTQFLPKEWIMEKWEDGFYITAMAGAASGASLVVMSKGTPYTQQSYKVSGACAAALGGGMSRAERRGGGGRVERVIRQCFDWQGESWRRWLCVPRHPHLQLTLLPALLPALPHCRLLSLQVDQQEVEGGLLW